MIQPNPYTLFTYFRPRFVLMMKVLRHSHFVADSWGDGGSKRTAQLSEILDFNEVEQTFYQPDITQIFQKKFAAIEGLRLLSHHKIASSLTKKALTQLGFNYFKRKQTLEFYRKDNHLLLWESTRQQNYLMGYAARDCGYQVIGLPHNLESLVAGQKSDFTGKEAPYWFYEELQSLSQCHCIFTISREEQYLLKLFGLDAEFLPYYPPSAVVEFLKSIRSARALKAKPGTILLMGTAGNKPTFDGMLDRINFFHKHLNHKEYTLEVAGYLTENLLNHLPSNQKIVLHGTVSNEKLADLMTSCSLAWIHQNISTGSLTKIPELMLAGVPVVLNSDSARNFHNIKGIRVYEHDEDCLDAIQAEPFVPEIPEKPVLHEQLLIKAIKRMS